MFVSTQNLGMVEFEKKAWSSLVQALLKALPKRSGYSKLQSIKFLISSRSHIPQLHQTICSSLLLPTQWIFYSYVIRIPCFPASDSYTLCVTPSCLFPHVWYVWAVIRSHLKLRLNKPRFHSLLPYMTCCRSTSNSWNHPGTVSLEDLQDCASMDFYIKGNCVYH